MQDASDGVNGFVIIIENLLHNAVLCCAMLIRGRPLNVWEGPGISCTLILRAKKFLQGNTRGKNFSYTEKKKSFMAYNPLKSQMFGAVVERDFCSLSKHSNNEQWFIET